jgi:hypothetical protein
MSHLQRSATPASCAKDPERNAQVWNVRATMSAFALLGTREGSCRL